ncbi:hypothetical protein GCM10025759_05190 [Lysobacter panacisoli]|uniref:Next to BRCA1 central domain-containing protein n=1 Tax=Lysobacter panacisoli TaxID=1255263 RepID=A0ABP9L481_9GAMM
MHYRIWVLLIAMLCCGPALALPKYFGYFANNTYQPETQAHTNITLIWTGGDDHPLSTWDNLILSELAQAKGYGTKAVVIVTSHLLDTRLDAQYKTDPFATAQFAALVDKLVAGGYLVPGNPEASTVASFYVIDEPEMHGLSDVAGGPHPALVYAVNVIRNNPATANFPTSAIESQDYEVSMQGMRLFDWAGLDHYPGNDGDYRNALTDFTNRMRPEQKLIIVPQAGRGGDLDDTWHNPEYMHFLSQAYGQTIMLMPFLWGHSAMTGTRAIPSLRNSYTAIGYQVKYGLYGGPVGISVPGTMYTGHYYNVSATFNNNSDKTWPAGSNISLGSFGPNDNTTWGLGRVALPHNVGPYQNVTFNFTVRAPSAPGYYNFQWKMVADGMAWFGTESQPLTINVVSPPSGSISASPNPCSIPYGGSTCISRLSWNSNRGDAEVWVSATDGSGAQLFARAQNGAQNAPWISTGTLRFTLKSGGAPITYVDVFGVPSAEPPYEPPPCPTPHCVEP